MEEQKQKQPIELGTFWRLEGPYVIKLAYFSAYFNLQASPRLRRLCAADVPVYWFNQYTAVRDGGIDSLLEPPPV